MGSNQERFLALTSATSSERTLECKRNGNAFFPLTDKADFPILGPSKTEFLSLLPGKDIQNALTFECLCDTCFIQGD